MSVARARSRDVNDIFRMESMIGRASKLLMSICSTGVLRISALVLGLDCASDILTYSIPRTAPRGQFFMQPDGLCPLARIRGEAPGRNDGHRGVRVEAVEGGAHGGAVGTELGDLDPVALALVFGLHERA